MNETRTMGRNEHRPWMREKQLGMFGDESFSTSSVSLVKTLLDERQQSPGYHVPLRLIPAEYTHGTGLVASSTTTEVSFNEVLAIPF